MIPDPVRHELLLEQYRHCHKRIIEDHRRSDNVEIWGAAGIGAIYASMLAQDSCMSYPIFSLLSFCIATLVLYRVRVLEAYLGSIQDRTEFIEKNSIIIPGD